MIKRYGLGAKAEKITDESVQFGLMGIVERPDGEYYKASDVDEYLESIGAGGVTGRTTGKTLEQHKEDFLEFLRSESVPVENPDKFDQVLIGYGWNVWKAARGVTE